MILKKNIIPVFLGAAALSATAAEADSLAYGQQELETAFGYYETRDAYTGSQSSVDAA